MPDLFLNGSDIPSFTHLTPWAVTLSSTVGVYRSAEHVTSAKRQITISDGIVLAGEL